MATVNNSTSTINNIYASMGIKTTGIGGLVSGLDTDSLVQALTAGTRAKIAKQGQDKQLLNWKITAYRSMTTALSAFQSKYFSYSSGSTTNISSNAFFNTYKATSNSSKVSLKVGSGASVGSFTIDKIQQIATYQTLKNETSLSKDLASSRTVDELFASRAALDGKSLSLTVDGSTKTIDLSSLKNAATQNEFMDGLQTLVDKAFGTKKDIDGSIVSIVNVNLVNAKDADGNVLVDGGGDPLKKISFNSDAAKITIAADSNQLGFLKGTSNRVSLDTKLGEVTGIGGKLEGDVFKFSINGVEISIGKNETLNTLMSRVNSSAAGVRMSYSNITDEFTLTAKSSGQGDNIVLRDTQGNLMNQIFGAQGGSSLGTKQLLLDQNEFTGVNDFLPDIGTMSASEKKTFLTNLSYMEFSVTYNGETKTVKIDSDALSSMKKAGDFTKEDIVSAFNKGIKTALGVASGYDSPIQMTLDGGKVKFTNYTPDVAFSVSASTTSSTRDAFGMFGFDASVGNSLLTLDYKTEIKADQAADSVMAQLRTAQQNGTLNLTINGETKELLINYSGDGTLAEKLNAAVKNAFGSETAKKLTFSVGSDGFVKLDIKDPNMSAALSEGHTDEDLKKLDVYGLMGFTEAKNNSNPTSANATTLGSLSAGANLTDAYETLTINGETFTYNKDTTLQKLISDINAEFGEGAAKIVNGQLSIGSNSNTSTITDTGSLLTDFFGIAKDGAVATYTTASKSSNFDANVLAGAGKNAEIIVDDKVISSASNTITLNGVDIEVTAVSDKDDAPIRINVASDSEDVVKKLKDWIADYNGLIATLTTAVNESKVSGYAPLTDEQKAEMTQDQIKNWEAEAQKGILRSDSTLRGIISDLRATLYQKVEAAGISLYDIGITTKGVFDNNAGQLEITEDGEKKLRAMLESDPDKVRMLFTDTTDGIAKRMNTVIDNAVRTSSVNRGTLVSLAGTDILTGDNTSSLSRKIDAIDKHVTTLKSRLEQEYNRYWKQFSALEVAIQKLNSQSSWLMQQ